MERQRPQEIVPGRLQNACNPSQLINKKFISPKLMHAFQFLLVPQATFMAAVQAPLLSSSFIRGNSTSSEVVTLLFTWGLMADLFGAVLNYGSARWFEMLTTEEAKYLQETWVAAETGKKSEPAPGSHPKPSFFEEWLSLSIRTGYYAAILGLILLLSGLLVSVWTQLHLRLVFRVISTFMCFFFAALIPPFACRHDRKATLYLLKLKRQSG
jgi:hypothetical protein